MKWARETSDLMTAAIGNVEKDGDRRLLDAVADDAARCRTFAARNEKKERQPCGGSVDIYNCNHNHTNHKDRNKDEIFDENDIEDDGEDDSADKEEENTKEKRSESTLVPSNNETVSNVPVLSAHYD